jgi:hypothetical protein
MAIEAFRNYFQRRSRNMKKSKLDEAFLEVDALIVFLNSRIGIEGKKYLFIRHEGIGSLQLDYEESSRYHKCLDNLVRITVKNDDLSRRSVEKALQEAILKAICTETKSISLDVRIRKVLDELRENLSRKSITYSCYVPVHGLKTEKLPSSIGQIEFAVFDDFQADKFRSAISKHTVQKEVKLKSFEKYINTDLKDKVFGIISVEAKDFEAAQILARKNLRIVLDILNYFSDMVPNHPSAWVYLPGDLKSHPFQALILNMEDEASYNFPSTRIPPFMELAISRITEADTKFSIGFTFINNLLKKKNRNKFEETVITAIQWAGRAVVTKRREESFLLYAIALESIILADNPDTELSYRLRIRIAHMLEEDFDSRQEIIKTVRDLYVLRSKLVHDGKYEITDLELRSIRAITRGCIIRICLDPIFQAMISPQDLAAWFDKQVLS